MTLWFNSSPALFVTLRRFHAIHEAAKTTDMCSKPQPGISSTPACIWNIGLRIFESCTALFADKHKKKPYLYSPVFLDGLTTIEQKAEPND